MEGKRRRVTEMEEEEEEGDADAGIAPLSVVGQTPIEDLKHPVLLALEGENQGLYELEELERWLAVACTRQPLEEDHPHFAAMRLRDADPLRNAHAWPTPYNAPPEAHTHPNVRTRHLESALGPLARKRFTSADIGPVRLVGAPKAKLEAQRALFPELLHLLLHRVVLDGFVERARTLVEMGADPSFNPPLADGSSIRVDSAVVLAVRSHNMPMLRALLPPKQPHHEDMLRRCVSDGELHRTPIAMLAASVDPSGLCLRTLLGARADPNARDADGRCALAMPDISLECVKELVADRRMVWPEDGESPLLVACQGGRLAIARYMLTTLDADPNGPSMGRGPTPLHMAAQCGHGALVELLLNESASATVVDAEDRSALHYAASANRGLAIMSLLVKTSRLMLSMVDIRGRTPLFAAVRLRCRRSIEALLALGASAGETNPQEGGQTVMHLAAVMGDAEVMRALLPTDDNGKCRLLLGLKDSQHRTPLQAALHSRQMATFEVLLPQSPLTCAMIGFAVRHEQWDFAEKLIRAGVPLMKSREETVLHDLVACFKAYTALPSAVVAQRMSNAALASVLHAIAERSPKLMAHKVRAAPLECEEQTPLQFAYHVGALHGAHLLLAHFLPRIPQADAEAALGVLDKHRRTLLHAMALYNDDTGLTLLSGAWPHAKSWIASRIQAAESVYGASALCLALASLRGCDCGYEIRVLTSKAQLHGLLPGACIDPNDVPSLPRNPSTRFVMDLLALGASPTHLDTKGLGPLHYCITTAALVLAPSVAAGNSEQVLKLFEVLAASGANNNNNTNNKSAETLVARINHPRITAAWAAFTAACKPSPPKRIRV